MEEVGWWRGAVRIWPGCIAGEAWRAPGRGRGLCQLAQQMFGGTPMTAVARQRCQHCSDDPTNNLFPQHLCGTQRT